MLISVIHLMHNAYSRINAAIVETTEKNSQQVY